MKFNGNRNVQWSPTLDFFKKGKALFLHSTKRETSEVFWKFFEIRKVTIPVSFVLCEMEAFGEKICGGGESLSTFTAMKKAFAEAWERIWMLHFSSEGFLYPRQMVSSNGFAAGSMEAEAFLLAQEELLERAIFLKAWQYQCGWTGYHLIDLFSKVLSHFFLKEKWEVNFFKINTTQEFFVLVGLVVQPNVGAFCDTVFVQNLDALKNKERKLIFSLIRTLLISKERNWRQDAAWKFPVNGSPMDQKIFYQDPKNLAAFDFLKNLKGVNALRVDLEEPTQMMTQIVVPLTNFPSVAVSYHPKWPKLSWGVESIAGINPWPHPLA